MAGEAHMAHILPFPRPQLTHLSEDLQLSILGQCNRPKQYMRDDRN